jgi:hypothetical protein
MRLLVCGGRAYADKRMVYAILDRIEIEHPIEVLIQGGADGADGLARDWAYDDRHHPTVAVQSFHADWKRFGKSAGPRRNRRMLIEGNPDLVVAFPGGRGTADMVRVVKLAGDRVIEVAACHPRRAVMAERVVVGRMR